MNSKTDSQTPIDPETAKAQKSAANQKAIGFGLILIALLAYGYSIINQTGGRHVNLRWDEVILSGLNLITILPLLVGIYFYRRGAQQLKKAGQPSSKIAS